MRTTLQPLSKPITAQKICSIAKVCGGKPLPNSSFYRGNSQCIECKSAIAKEKWEEKKSNRDNVFI